MEMEISNEVFLKKHSIDLAFRERKRSNQARYVWSADRVVYTPRMWWADQYGTAALALIFVWRN